MVAQQRDLKVKEFIWTGGDVHRYLNHQEQAKTQLARHPKPLPRLNLKPQKSLFDYAYTDIEIVDYQHHPHIKAPVAI